MTYVGNLSESYAAHYQDRRYTHSEFASTGRETRYFDCWTHEDETPPAFKDDLQIDKARAFDKIIRGKFSPYKTDDDL